MWTLQYCFRFCYRFKLTITEKMGQIILRKIELNNFESDLPVGWSKEA